MCRQVVDLLLKLYKFPDFSISRALLHGSSSGSAVGGGGTASRVADVPIGAACIAPVKLNFHCT